MVGDAVVEVLVDNSVGDENVSGEDLVQVVSELVSSHIWCYCRHKVHGVEYSRNYVQMIVEVSTDHYRRVFVLAEDVLNNFAYPLCSLFRICQVSSFQVTIEDLDRLCPCVESCPAEVGAKCLDQRMSNVVGLLSSSPASAFSCE